MSHRIIPRAEWGARHGFGRFADDGWNLTASASVQKTDRILGSDRDFARRLNAAEQNERRSGEARELVGQPDQLPSFGRERAVSELCNRRHVGDVPPEPKQEERRKRPEPRRRQLLAIAELARLRLELARAGKSGAAGPTEDC